MRIVSDNAELLDNIHKELKLARIKAKKETKTVDGAMGDLTIAVEIFYKVGDILIVVGAIRETIALGKYLKSQIKVELKDGSFISWEAYENMNDEELREVFSTH